MAGYSGTPLQQKLGIRENMRAFVFGCPGDYAKLTGELPENFVVKKTLSGDFDFMHLFVRSIHEFEDKIRSSARCLNVNGMLWASWPKKSSGLSTDLTENIIRETGLKNNLVDIKVCAVDETWSGLKFVFRKKDRAEISASRKSKKS